jgi:hypothetical protein
VTADPSIRREIVVSRLGIAIVTFTMVIGSATEVAGQQETASPSPAVSTTLEHARSTPGGLDEHTCIDPDFLWPASAHGNDVGVLLQCAKALGLTKGDPEYEADDFTLMKRTESRERWTQQCDEEGTLTGTRYHAWGTDTLYRNDKPKQALSGTFDFTVVSTLIDPVADTWRVETQGVTWDVHSPEGDLGGTWAVEMTRESDGTSDMPRPDEYSPQLDLYRGLEREAFRVFCEYLK